MLRSFGLTDKGAVRADNQDSFIIEKCDAADCVIISLCDGMGGAKAGGLASRLSNKAFVSYIYGKLTSGTKRKIDFMQMLKDACSEANGVSYEYSRFDEMYYGMGTTIVGGVIKSNGKGYIINVGDSRAYYLSLKNKTCTQITKDHSLVQELVEFGAITKEQARNHPKKNVITRALGSEIDVKPDCYETELAAGDVLLFCSDGLSNTITEKELLSCAYENRQPELLCRALMEKALNRRAKDNVTVIAVMR